jgi:hypothetical protein
MRKAEVSRIGRQVAAMLGCDYLPTLEAAVQQTRQQFKSKDSGESTGRRDDSIVASTPPDR